jgi:phosphatidylglycerol---prolipoprotein diacylglyceryl transferase
VHPVLFRVGSILIPSYGVMAAVGALLALVTAQRTAQATGVNRAHMWNLCVLAVCAALAGERLLLVAANWSQVRRHPGWVQALAMVHHPLLAGGGALAGLGVAWWYAHHFKMPLRATADALAAPLALGLACEQLGALLAGSGYGTEAVQGLRWAVTYTSPQAALESGTPLGVPLHPVQAYAALGYFVLATLLFVFLPARRRAGDVVGLWLMGAGALIYLTEIWRDPAGRGLLFDGGLDGPQVAAIAMVVVGAVVVWERRRSPEDRALPPLRQEEVARMGHGNAVGGKADPDEAGHE